MAKRRSGKRKGGIGRLPGMNDTIAKSVRGASQVAYGPALHEQSGIVKQLRSHRGVINNAYEAYQRQLKALQGAQMAAVNNARASQGALVMGLEGVGSRMTDAAAADAARRSELLGQSGSVEGGIASLGVGASAARESQAIGGDTAMANIGLAHSSDLGRRAATGSRDRIRALEDLLDQIVEARKDRVQTRKERGGFMADTAYERLQQEKENEIARAGLRLDRRGQRQDAKEAKRDDEREDKKLELDIYDTVTDNLQDAKDAKASASDGGLSDSEQGDYRKTVNQVKAVASEYSKLIKRGVEPNKAARMARKRMGAERWQAVIAKQLISQGGLNSRGRHLLKGKLPPGAKIPKAWR